MIPLPPRSRFFSYFLQRPPLLAAWATSLAAFGIVAFFNLGPLRSVPIGVAYALPMCLCLWSRNRLLLYLMALAGTVLGFYKTVLLPPGLIDGYSTRVITYSFQLINIWIPALAFHLAMYSFDRLDLKRKLLLEANAELDAANRELAVREQEILVKRREAEEASVQKTRFLAAVSHDVRTPANAISLIADLIEQSVHSVSAGDGAPGKPADLPQLAHDLKSSARSLVELVSDVLDLARLDTGKLDLQTSDFPLAPLLENEVRQFEHIASEKNLRLTLHPLPDHLHLRTDRMKVARIIANLLGNAIKFTETGGVEVKVLLQPDSSLKLLIADTGVGISSEALPRIFDEFYQIHNPERDRNKGAGLGLAICKRLVDSLGCTLGVDSTVGRGTTFAIALPETMVVTCAHPLPPASSNSKHNHSLDQIKILIVEDHDITRKAAARLLASHGASILEARSGREALHIIVHDQPHVLLLDLMLPDGDGTGVLKQLQRYRQPSLRCVLAVSGDVRDARVSEVVELGADGLLAKPLDIEKLLSVITSRLASPKPAVYDGAEQSALPRK